jgi:uncharacterized protein YdeI (YjbR/CyaY-like superfamily)
MTKSGMNPKVDVFLSKTKQWREEFEKLRGIILDCHLTEEFKWGKPCYTFQKSNIVLIHGFKEYCALDEMESTLRACVHEAIEVEKAGLEVTLKKTSEFRIPEEFQNKLDAIPALKTAFHALTPGRQRGYILYFSAPKQSKTRESRVEKCKRQILKGKGLDDQ